MMMKYNMYPTLPTEPSAPLEPQSYQLNIIQSEQQGLLKLEERYKKKYKKYTKILNLLVWLNACLSSIATGILSMATLSIFIGLPVSIPLGGVPLAGASVGGMATALTKKYQKKLAKVTNLIDIVTSASAVFEMSMSKVLNDGKIDEQEFQVFQTLDLKIINELSNVDCKMESKTRNQL